MTHHKVSDEARRGMAPAMFAFVGALAAVIFSVLYLLFGATAGDYCQCTTSLAQGDDRCHNCGKLLRELPKKGQSK